MKLFQLKDGYRYNSDSLFLWDFARKNCSFKASQSLLDVGCGCGILGLLLARDFNCALSCIDIQPQNCELAQINAQANDIKASIICADFFKDWESGNSRIPSGFDENSRIPSNFDGNFRIPSSFERIICNPPFYDFGGENKNAHKNTSRNASSFDISAFASKCFKLLAPKGELVLCYDARLVDRLLQALLQAGLKPIKLAFLHSKPSKPANIVLVVAKKGAKSPLCVFGSLFACNESGTHSDFAKEVFIKADLISVDLQALI
ncbi:tRNA1(Val) (adenine(37)-N6)-methyltransferase [Campylobacter sp.]|uniref:tRNA1(Val) (adenine(37)-N6)-methyltransferase n=1 Tax=Campylobacter sp. TaxID=205 RepID=UPI002A6674CF|nr:methyltransferase [Campylobacter sp.]MDD7704072.1 methyltransferase [Campylobacteraceae bacterium]MDY2635206.1 methyltransferase [Campylobacter sp.]